MQVLDHAAVYLAGISAAALALYMASLLYRVVSSITKSASAARSVLLSQPSQQQQQSRSCIMLA
jgi:hypothetical protein